MSTIRPIGSVSAFLAQAVAIEREAAKRYQEFAQHMKDREDGQQHVAELFRRMAREGLAHAGEIAGRAKPGRIRASAPGAYAWLDNGQPQPAAHEWLFGLLTPRDALKVAVHAEQRAKRFFEHVLQTTRDGEVKAIARTFLDEEGEHIARMKRALRKLPNPVVDWEKVYAHGGPIERRQAARPPEAKPRAPKPVLGAGKPRTAVKLAAAARKSARSAAKTPGKTPQRHDATRRT
jgi:rubrerythrin